MFSFVSTEMMNLQFDTSNSSNEIYMLTDGLCLF